MRDIIKNKPLLEEVIINKSGLKIHMNKDKITVENKVKVIIINNKNSSK